MTVPAAVLAQDFLRLRAAELLDIFAVYGHYYCARIGRGSEAPLEALRSRLEIAPRQWAQSDLDDRQADLLVIMMNPGASRPLETLWDKAAPDGLVAAQPDRTQYQIMRLLCAAQAMGVPWRHARVVNLSDLRTPKSAEILAKLRLYQGEDSHSLFSQTRQAERQRWLGADSTPVLCAWGLDPGLSDLASRALQAVAAHPLLGWSQGPFGYRHPLPQTHNLQQQWLQVVVDQLAARHRR